MEFFKGLSEIMGRQMSISILQHDNKMTIMLEPKGTDVKIQPLTITGTPEELDAGLFDEIGKTLEDTKGIVSNIRVYESAVKETEKAVKEKAKEKTAKRGKKVVQKKVENVEKTEELKKSLEKKVETSLEKVETPAPIIPDEVKPDNEVTEPPKEEAEKGMFA